MSVLRELRKLLYGYKPSEKEKYLEHEVKTLRKQNQRLREKQSFDTAKDVQDFLIGRHVVGKKQEIKELQKTVSRMVEEK